MTVLAFRDSDDGYYEAEVHDGEDIPAWALKLTPCDVVVHTQTKAERKALIRSQIDEIETRTKMNKGVRQGMMRMLEYVASAQGVTPAMLYLNNSAYHDFKDVDDQIAALEAQL